MRELSFDQKKTLVAYEHFYGSRYNTHVGEVGSTGLHVETQKMCYLLKVAGVEIGDFDYSWNFKGPFSPGLLALLRSMDRNENVVQSFYGEQSEKESILSDCLTRIDKLRADLEIDEHQEQPVQWIEILGSMTYISRVMLPGANFETVNQRLVGEKSEYNDENTNHHAWELLERADMLSVATAY